MRQKALIFIRKGLLIMAALVLAGPQVMPSGIHVVFCFGDDGHFDVSMDSCPDGESMTPFQNETRLISTSFHHEDCQDYSLICGNGFDFVSQKQTSSVVPKWSKPLTGLASVSFLLFRDQINQKPFVESSSPLGTVRLACQKTRVLQI